MTQKHFKHGLNGYTNFNCRCKICTEANRLYVAHYRKTAVPKNERCLFEPCQKRQDRQGRGLCRDHYEMLSHLIRKGIRDWDELIFIGYAKPTRAEIKQNIKDRLERRYKAMVSHIRAD